MFQNIKIYKALRFLILLGILFVPTFFYTNGFYKDANIRILSHYQQEFIREKRVGTATTKEKVKRKYNIGNVNRNENTQILRLW